MRKAVEGATDRDQEHWRLSSDVAGQVKAVLEISSPNGILVLRRDLAHAECAWPASMMNLSSTLPQASANAETPKPHEGMRFGVGFFSASPTLQSCFFEAGYVGNGPTGDLARIIEVLEGRASQIAAAKQIMERGEYQRLLVVNINGRPRSASEDFVIRTDDRLLLFAADAEGDIKLSVFRPGVPLAGPVGDNSVSVAGKVMPSGGLMIHELRIIDPISGRRRQFTLDFQTRGESVNSLMEQLIQRFKGYGI